MNVIFIMIICLNITLTFLRNASTSWNYCSVIFYFLFDYMFVCYKIAFSKFFRFIFVTFIVINGGVLDFNTRRQWFYVYVCAVK